MGGQAENSLPSAFDLCTRAERKLAAGDAAAALADLEGAAALDSAQPWIYHLQGIACLRLGQASEAIKAFERTSALDPTYRAPDFLLEAGRALLDASRPRDALRLAERSKAPEPSLLVLMARARLALGDLPGAAATVDKALSSDPTLKSAEKLKGELAAQLQARESRYTPGAAPERLGEGKLKIAGLATLRLPKTFAARGRKARCKHEAGEILMTLTRAEDPGGETIAWVTQLAEADRRHGGRVVASRTSVGDRDGVFLHVVEPSPESGMFDPFSIVRYRWLLRGPKGSVEILAEGELGEEDTDFPDDVRQDLLAAVASLAFDD
jgi:tetratricopeptide (TPR) repeat protein